jgi:hypothetical protein
MERLVVKPYRECYSWTGTVGPGYCKCLQEYRGRIAVVQMSVQAGNPLPGRYSHTE